MTSSVPIRRYFPWEPAIFPHPPSWLTPVNQACTLTGCLLSPTRPVLGLRLPVLALWPAPYSSLESVLSPVGSGPLHLLLSLSWESVSNHSNLAYWARGPPNLHVLLPPSMPRTLYSPAHVPSVAASPCFMLTPSLTATLSSHSSPRNSVTHGSAHSSRCLSGFHCIQRKQDPSGWPAGRVPSPAYTPLVCVPLWGMHSPQILTGLSPSFPDHPPSMGPISISLLPHPRGLSLQNLPEQVSF